MSRVVVAAFLFALASSPLWAQGETVNARLTGVVLDPDNAPVPDAKVTLASPATGFERQFATGTDGRYTFSQVPPGRYGLKVEKEGFRAYVQSNIVLTVGQASTLNPALELGSISQVVEVTAEAPLLNTGNSGIGTEVSGKQAVELPLNIRNMFNLVTLSSAVNNNLEYQAFT
ncbi:MAG: carboxypeptidase regulatory-like domain-containing protein [Acidobacteria bacterium]|nr:carboxypeptidase regulatory-like domain-containing protein [Acidobacteriota bacterium]